MKFKVNNKSVDYSGDGDMPLLWFLCDIEGMTGTKFGCGEGLCGACTVHLDGVAVRSCQTDMADVGGATITTIEGLASGGKLHALQQAWSDHDVPQCGYCQSGQIMQAASLLAETRTPAMRILTTRWKEISVAAAHISGLKKPSAMWQEGHHDSATE